MNATAVYPPQVEVRAHVLEPLAFAGGDDPAAGAADGGQPAANPLWREGYQHGLEDGRRQAEQPLATLAEALACALRQFEAAREHFSERAQRELLDLSLAIARQVVMGEMKTRPEAIAQIVSQLLEAAGRDKKVFAVRLHPLDAERIKSFPAALEKLQQAGIAVEASAEIASPGGAILETGFGKLDARLETRLDEIAASLLGEDRPAAAERGRGASPVRTTAGGGCATAEVPA